MKERILEELRKLGRTEKEGLMDFAAERSVSMLQAYCNRRDLPEELLGVGVALAGRLLENDGMTAQAVQSIKEGDVSVTFAKRENETELLSAFRTELDRFRRADW